MFAANSELTGVDDNMQGIDDTTVGVIGIGGVGITGLVIVGYCVTTGIQNTAEICTLVVSVCGMIGALIRSYSPNPKQ